MDETKRQKLYKQIFENLEIKRVGDEFFVENLLPHQVWLELSVGERQSLGQMFKNKVKSNEIDNVKHINPNKKQKNKYRKTKK